MSQVDWLAPLSVEPENIQQDEIDWRERACGYKGAEFLVAADLSFAGYSCSMAAEALPYDLIVDNQERIFTLQIKSSSVLRQNANHGLLRHEFSILRRGTCGAGAEGRIRSRYDKMVDIFALVSLPHRLIVYRKAIEVPRNIRILPDKFTPEMQDLSRREAFRR